MRIKKSVLKNIGFALIAFLLVIAGITVFSPNKPPAGNVVTMENGKQIINITARGGYFPQQIEAKADRETILKVSTKNTFDCSLALTIPALGVQKNLPPSGETEIEIEPQESGKVITGTCSMGMYGFQIKFV